MATQSTFGNFMVAAKWRHPNSMTYEPPTQATAMQGKTRSLFDNEVSTPSTKKDKRKTEVFKTSGGYFNTNLGSFGPSHPYKVNISPRFSKKYSFNNHITPDSFAVNPHRRFI